MAAVERGSGPWLTVVGSTMIDQIAYAARMPERGETVIGDRFAQGFGGKGANQAVMARLMGAQVAMVNAVGDDSYGEQTLANFARYGIDTTHMRRVPGSSGVAPIWVEPDGSNRIIIVPGANDGLLPEHGAAAVEAQARVDAVIAQFEIRQAVTAAAFRAARERGARTILNPAPGAAIDPGLAEVSDWIIPNETEFAIIARAAGLRDDAMVHVGATPGAPLHDEARGVEGIVTDARADLRALQEAGFDAVMFGNEHDRPYELQVDVAATATMAYVIGRLRDEIRVPFGVNVLWDPSATLALAAATGAAFVREIFTGTYASDMGPWSYRRRRRPALWPPAGRGRGREALQRLRRVRRFPDRRSLPDRRARPSSPRSRTPSSCRAPSRGSPPP